MQLSAKEKVRQEQSGLINAMVGSTHKGGVGHRVSTVHSSLSQDSELSSLSSLKQALVTKLMDRNSKVHTPNTTVYYDIVCI